MIPPTGSRIEVNYRTPGYTPLWVSGIFGWWTPDGKFLFWPDYEGPIELPVRRAMRYERTREEIRSTDTLTTGG